MIYFDFKKIISVNVNGSQYDITPTLVTASSKNETIDFCHVVQKENKLLTSIEDSVIPMTHSNTCKAKQEQKHRKRGVNDQPVNFYVEYLVVLDYTVYNKYQILFNTLNSNRLIDYLRIQYAHIINAVSLIFSFLISFKFL